MHASGRFVIPDNAGCDAPDVLSARIELCRRGGGGGGAERDRPHPEIPRSRIISSFIRHTRPSSERFASMIHARICAALHRRGRPTAVRPYSWVAAYPGEMVVVESRLATASRVTPVLKVSRGPRDVNDQVSAPIYHSPRTHPDVHVEARSGKRSLFGLEREGPRRRTDFCSHQCHDRRGAARTSTTSDPARKLPNGHYCSASLAYVGHT